MTDGSMSDIARIPPLMVAMRSCPNGRVCHAVRVPASNIYDGFEQRRIGRPKQRSMRTIPAKQSSGRSRKQRRPPQEIRCFRALSSKEPFRGVFDKLAGWILSVATPQKSQLAGHFARSFLNSSKQGAHCRICARTFESSELAGFKTNFSSHS